MKHLTLLILVCCALKADAHCWNRSTEYLCKKARRCYWGNAGCTAQKNLAKPGASILNYFRDTPSS